MGQNTGINTLLFFDQFDVSGDGNRVGISRSAEAPEKTTFQPAGRTRQRSGSGLRDWTVSFDGFFNDVSPSGVDALFGGRFGGGSMLGVYFDGSAAASQVGYEGTPLTTAYNRESPVDGMVTVSAEWSGSGPLLRTIVVRTGSLDSSSGSAVTNSIDLGGDIATLRAFARVYRETSLGSGSGFKLTLQHGGNDSVFSSLGALDTTFTASGLEQKQFTSASRYVRLATCPQGTAPTAWIFLAVGIED